ncbi:MAG: hypothetical protein PHX18_04085 [Candidatus Gastranaerophilales bacterium]|nr:hypothetical protein [Candidatus Gastranaerophilales bacterium]
MSLDGLTNANFALYRPVAPSETAHQAEVESKQRAEVYLKTVEQAEKDAKINPDEKKEKDNKKKQLAIKKTNELIEQDDDEKILELTLEDGESVEELKYTVKFNSVKKIIEMIDVTTNKIIQEVSPEELLMVLDKAKSASGMFVDKKI